MLVPVGSDIVDNKGEPAITVMLNRWNRTKDSRGRVKQRSLTDDTATASSTPDWNASTSLSVLSETSIESMVSYDSGSDLIYDFTNRSGIHAHSFHQPLAEMHVVNLATPSHTLQLRRLPLSRASSTSTRRDPALRRRPRRTSCVAKPDLQVR
jgi:hypothetical protein